MISYDVKRNGILVEVTVVLKEAVCISRLILLFLAFASVSGYSQTQDESLVEEANRLFESGQFQKAYGAFSQLVSLNPSSGEYNYKFGACSVYADADKTKAVRYLKMALKYNCTDPMVHYYLGRALHLNYQFKEAQDSYKTFISKANPKSRMISAAQLDMTAAANGSGLLSNIKDITVLNKTETDRVNFFRYYNLEGIGGRILALPEELKTKLDKKNNHNAIIHFPGNGTTLYFSSYGKDGSTGKDIYRANVMPDGTYSIPEKLGGGVNTSADEDFCFMHSDGATLFFSSTGHNSMGGYDVFRSLYDAANNHFSAAVNLDFAINTPDDDIFYIADSLKQRAYFASGRSSDLEHLHVYNVLVESTPLQVVYFKGNYSNEINPEETGYGYSIKEKTSGRVVCSGNARSSDGGYVSFVPKSGEYVMSVITSQSPKVHEVSLNIPIFQKPVAIRQEAKLIEQGGDKLIVNTYFDTPLDEDLSALASDMLRTKARLEVNANDAPVAKKEETATISTYERSMQNAAMIAGFGSGTSIESIMEQYQTEIETLQKEVRDAQEKSEQASKNAIYAQREAEKLLNQAEKFKATGNPNQKATLDSLIAQTQLLQRADSLLILSAVFRETQNSLPELTIKKQSTLTKRESSLGELDSLYRQGNPENVISFLIEEKSNPEGMAVANLLKPYEDQFNEKKQTLVKEENKLTSLRNKELETIDDIKSNEAILKRTTDPMERQNVESRLAVLQQDLAEDRKRIADQKSAISVANRKVIESEKLLTILRNPKQGIAPISDAQFTLSTPVAETQFTALQNELMTKREGLRVRDPKVQMMIEEALASAGGVDATSSSVSVSAVVTPNNVAENAAPLQGISNSNPSDSAIEGDNLSGGTTPTGRDNISKLESKYESDLLLASGRPDSLQIKSLAAYNATNGLWVENARLEKVIASGNATARDSSNYRMVNEDIERIAQTTPNRLVPLTNEALSTELLRQDPEYLERKSSLQNNVTAAEALAYKIQLIEQLMLSRSDNAERIGNTVSPQDISNITQRDAEIERAIYTLIADDAEVKQAKVQYDSAMKVLIESDMDYPQKLERQYDLTLTYERQLAQLERAATINGMSQETTSIKFVSSERDAVRVKLIAYKKEHERTQPESDKELPSTLADAADAKPSVDNLSSNNEIAVKTSTPETSSGSGADVANNSATQNTTDSNSTIGSISPTTVTDVTQTDQDNQEMSTSYEKVAAGSNNTGIAETTLKVDPANTKGNQGTIEITAEPDNVTEAPEVISESAVYVAKANTAKEEAGSLWKEKAEPTPEILLSKPAQIGFSKVMASPQFKSMLYTSQSGKPIKRLKEYESNEEEIQNIDSRMQAANGNLDTLRALDSRKNKLLSTQNKIEIENSEEYSRIVKRNYNEQRLATDKRMENLPAAVRNRAVLNDAMLSKLRKADSLMVEAVILKSEAAWAYNEEEKADLFKMALAKQIQSIEMLRQVELMSQNSKELLAMSDSEIKALTRQIGGADVASSNGNDSANSSTQNAENSLSESVADAADVKKENSKPEVISSNDKVLSNSPQTTQDIASVTPKNATEEMANSASHSELSNNEITAKDASSSNVVTPKADSSNTPNENSNPTDSRSTIASENSSGVQAANPVGNATDRNDVNDNSAPIFIDPYADNNIVSNTSEPRVEMPHTLVIEENIPTAKEQKEMTRPEQAKWMISVLEDPEELPETEVYDTQVMQELIEQQSAERSIKNKEQLIQLNQQILLLEDEMSNTTSKPQLRRLDYQREELYTQRASIEIENAAVIQEMAKHEYNERKLSADSVLNNSVKYNELSTSVQEIIREKNRVSDSLLIQSLLFRAQAENAVEPLEKAYFYREGFACQVKSIELMQQVKSLVYAGPTLKSWSDSDIALMQNGKLPAELNTGTAALDKASVNTNVAPTAAVASADKEVVSNKVLETAKDVVQQTAENTSSIPVKTKTVASEVEVKSFYYKSPDRVTTELSVLNAKGVYGINNPIPVDAPLPKGVYYKVQVGAFRNKIPQNLFDGFAPLHGESVSNGLVRYTAGFYMTLDRAKSAKNQIRDLGYKDAFVVAYKDGIRIPIYEAIKASEGQEAADKFAAANPAAGPAKTSPASGSSANAQVSDLAANKTNTNAAKPEAQNPPPPPPPLVTGYTKDYKDAAPSTEVETIQGVFFTVQVGVYTTPVPLNKLFNLKPLNTELTETKKIRYTTGRYDTLESATARRDEIRAIGVKDAFVTAYLNGRRVTIAEALEKLKK